MQKERRPRLYSDDSTESQEARKLLGANGIEYFDIVKGQGVQFERGMVPPVLQSAEGDFSGLEGVNDYIALLTDPPSASGFD
ncbi:hypothetical protein HYT59_01150 [Candidatus Woesebacteria bacterium]|nr:hypothetical protein [Candidatus Woesebacteria bacterium]